MEQKKLEAEMKLMAKRFAAEQIGLSWFKALRQEFKRPYMQQVRLKHSLGCILVSHGQTLVERGRCGRRLQTQHIPEGMGIMCPAPHSHKTSCQHRVLLQLVEFVNLERSKATVYPPEKDVFSWTLCCAINEVGGAAA